jgi:hypothetical protein
MINASMGKTTDLTGFFMPNIEEMFAGKIPPFLSLTWIAFEELGKRVKASLIGTFNAVASAIGGLINSSIKAVEGLANSIIQAQQDHPRNEHHKTIRKNQEHRDDINTNSEHPSNFSSNRV